MSATYDVQTYLLDRANIHDTVFKLMQSFDEVDTPKLVNAVYAPKVHLDYTAIMGGEPQHLESEVWAKSLEPIHSAYEATQHVVQDLLIELPQPTGKSKPRPNSCTAICVGDAKFYRRNGDGLPCVMERRTGGRYDLELVRVPELEEKGENPWRISKQTVKLSVMDLGAAPEAK
ncbi:hypothetical protein PFICI_00489 [Pestalotiopsis fici W106-1]|uniref:SnoaL-like domain-containing protein n=1 Tax=Pestalotiopsis fici (strain W106-1 / CGMCC3.15140) TaxID=1229662 RepID=W3XN01_PESFW|nr:uncharacterized protein PFICI_00489 [Pestalotiopsis fici W106-1]ETS86661.1 hypothetical protein PFICI_00489 [Pestalotiopsis fici W106-1]